MKRIILFVLVAASALALSACGGSAPAAAPTAVPAEPTETAMPTAEAPTQPAAAAEPTATVSADPSPIRVEVALADNTINANVNSFKTGVPYTFVIMNNGRHEHNFNIAPPVALAGGYAEALAQALLAVDETQIPPGSSLSVEFTFPESAAGATLEFSCLIRRHYEDGMRQDITVSN